MQPLSVFCGSPTLPPLYPSPNPLRRRSEPYGSMPDNMAGASAVFAGPTPSTSLDSFEGRLVKLQDRESKCRQVQQENHELRQQLFLANKRQQLILKSLQHEQERTHRRDSRLNLLRARLCEANERCVDAVEETHCLWLEVMRLRDSCSSNGSAAIPTCPLDHQLALRARHSTEPHPQDTALRPANRISKTYQPPRRGALSASPDSYLARRLQELSVNVACLASTDPDLPTNARCCSHRDAEPSPRKAARNLHAARRGAGIAAAPVVSTAQAKETAAHRVLPPTLLPSNSDPLTRAPRTALKRAKRLPRPDDAHLVRSGVTKNQSPTATPRVGGRRRERARGDDSTTFDGAKEEVSLVQGDGYGPVL